MKYINFTIKNYKGINQLHLDLNKSPESPIVTMVGLNESGKTTILESLFFFYENIGNEEEITLHRGVVDALHKLIPKRLKDNFNDVVEITANILIEDEDKKKLFNKCADQKFKINFTGNTLKIKHSYKFENSKHSKTNRFWTIPIEIKPPKARKFRSLQSGTTEWDTLISAFKGIIPPIIYYPNFLFDFPRKIYLSEEEDESIEQEFYRRLIQDILDSLENDLTIEDHLISRASSIAADDRDALESVINKMKVRVSNLIFNPELSVFQNKDISKTISFSLPKKDPASEIYYIEIKLRDGEDSFFIEERSLGFRWFFTFLLFTQYRVRRIQGGGKPVFLFDEPASNLHQTAQKRLLKAFEDLSTKFGATIIYSTHSHHLINPRWLEGTFIVQNKALNYDDDSSYSAAMTDITALRYRAFVGKHPNQRTYFQPILDVLEYQPSDLENIPSVIMVEGKNDFYAIKYISDLYLDNKLNVLPGGGAGTLDTAIQLYISWARNFIVLLDNDHEGYRQKERYIERFGKIIEERIITLPSILGISKKIMIEKLFTKDDRFKFQSFFDKDPKRFNKKKFFLAIQESLARKNKIQLEKETVENFKNLSKQLLSLLHKTQNTI